MSAFLSQCITNLITLPTYTLVMRSTERKFENHLSYLYFAENVLPTNVFLIYDWRPQQPIGWPAIGLYSEVLPAYLNRMLHDFYLG